MSSKTGRFLSWMMSCLLGAFFLLAGAFCIALPWSETVKAEIIGWILDGQLAIALFGLGFVLIGLSILFYHFLLMRRRTVYIRMGKQAIGIDKELVHQYLDRYWQELFPHRQIPFVIAIKKKAIHITADLPPLSSGEEHVFRERAEKDLNDIFGRLLGYPHQVFFTASFKNLKH